MNISITPPPAAKPAGRATKFILPRLSSVRIVAAGFAAAGMLSSTLGASDTWTGATNSLWNDGLNWQGFQIPVAGETATFNAGSSNTTIDLTGGVSVGSIVFDTSSAAAYTIGSGAVNSQALTLSTPGGGISLTSSVVANQLFNSSLSLGSSGTYSLVNQSTTAGLTVAGGITAASAGTATLAVGGAGSTALSGIIGNGSGTVGIDKSGTGILTLSGANTFTGPTVITEGAVSIAANNNLGATAATVTLNGGTLRTTNTGAGGLTNTHAFTIGASGGEIRVSGTATTGQNSRVIFNTAGLLSGTGALTVTGNGALDAAGGSGVLVLNQANAAFTGNVTLQNGGMIEVGNAGALATGATVTLGNKGGLNINSGITFSNAIAVSGTGSVISFSNGNLGVISGPITLNNDVTIGLRDWYNLNTNRNGTITGNILGAKTINVVSGASNLGTGSTLTLGGFDAKASSSDIVLNGASLALNSNSGTAAASVTRANSLTINTGNLTVTGVASQNTNDVFGTLNLGNGSAGSLQGYSTWTLAQNAATNTALTFTDMGTRTAGSWVAISSGTLGVTPAANTSNIYFTNGLSGSNLIGAGGSLASGTASVIGWMRDTVGGAIYGYDATNGVGVVTTVSTANLNTAVSGLNALLSGANGSTQTLTADKSINSLQAGFINVNMGGNTLTVASGVITADNSTFSNGTLDFGTAEGQLSIHQARTLTINASIAGSNGLTSVGFRTSSGNAGALVLGGSNTYTGVSNFYGYGAATAVVNLTNTYAFQNTTLNHVAGRGYTLNFGAGGTSGQTAYTFGGLTGNGNINLNNNNTTVGAVALTLGSAGSADSSSTVNTYSGTLTSTVAGGSIIKAGVATQVFTAANTYDGGTTVNAGTLLVNNTAGSGVGTGAVTVNGGVLGGTGFIVPTGANGITVNSGGFIAPGASIGTLTINLAGTTGTVQMLSSSGFKFELGAAGTLANPGTSDLLVLSGASAGDLAFNDNAVDFLGTGAVGYYKVIDTSLDATTYSGLSFDSITGVVSSGLTAANLGSGLTGTFVVGTASNGGSVGDIYVAVAAVPEPGTLLMAGMGVASVVFLRRRRLA